MHRRRARALGLLKRRILGKFSDRSQKLEEIVSALIDANYLLRDETPLNFGPLMFLPVHAAFGGRIRYLISGGSALSESTLKTFRGLGFNLNEGYGLTEASPVLTVTRPEGSVVSGSVGQPLPGVEIKIHEPDRRGVGEVIAKGPNIMAGYYGNEKATGETLRDGWLFTGRPGTSRRRRQPLHRRPLQRAHRRSKRQERLPRRARRGLRERRADQRARRHWSSRRGRRAGRRGGGAQA